MNDARIAELLEPFLSDNSRSTAALSPAQAQLISMYVDLLLRWNDRVNLTAIRKPEDIVTRHFGESIFAARQLFPQPEVGAGTTAHV
jgi:16S rRNA (guanine527-N7)-methyltransferase